MQNIFCQEHRFELNIPTTDGEFLLGKMHDNIMQLQSHHKQFPNCKFLEVQEKL